ncbi:MAG TPA: glycosyltransferase family 39 protein [bacterium]|nr:glycosyltransferase family 39 protein [bacterium]
MRANGEPDLTVQTRRPAEKREFLAVAAVLGLAVLARLEHLGTRTLWGDEGFALDLARRGFFDLLTHLRGTDAHPLGYYVMLSYWIRTVGEDLAMMRALSAIFGVAAVALTWWLGRRLFSPAVGVGAAALMALNPFQIFASNELRMYMPLEFLVLASTLILWRARSERGYGWWLAYGASLAAMAYISYYAFLLMPAHLVWILLHEKPREALRRMGVALGTAAVLYAPWIPYVSGVVTFLRTNQLSLRGQTITWTYVPELVAAQTFGGYLFNGVTYHTLQALDFMSYVPLLVPFVLLAAIGYGALGTINRSARMLIVLSWAIPVALVVAVSFAAGGIAAYYYHLNFLAPFLAFALAAGVVHFRDIVTTAPRPLVTLGAAIGVLAFVAPAVENLQSNPSYQSYRYDNAARLVRKLYQTGDVVIFLPGGVSKAFHFYFDPPGKEFGIAVVRGGWTRQALQEPIREVTQSLGPNDKRVWLVYGPPIPEGAVDDLLKAIEGRGYKRAEVNDYRGIRVGLLVRPVKQHGSN